MQFRMLAISALSAVIAAGCASQQKAETASAPEVVPAPAKAVPVEKPKMQMRRSGSILTAAVVPLLNGQEAGSNITSDIFG